MVSEPASLASPSFRIDPAPPVVSRDAWDARDEDPATWRPLLEPCVAAQKTRPGKRPCLSERPDIPVIFDVNPDLSFSRGFSA